MLSSCGQETLSGGGPHPGGLCSKKGTSLLLNRCLAAREKPGLAHPAETPVCGLPPGTPAAAPFLSLVQLPLPPDTAHFVPSPSSCSRPSPPLRVKHPSERLWTREPGVGGLARVPAALPVFSLLQPPAPSLAPSLAPSSVAPGSRAAPRARSKASAPFPTRGRAGQAPCRPGCRGQGGH